MIELLAPAGSLESFYAALDAGADAVYAGGSRFGARAYAQNFTQEEMIEAIRHGHSRGKKLYLTVNTLMKSRELSRELFDYLAPYYEAGLDAVIVQDLGVLSFVQKYFPGLPIHISTQMTVTGPECMEFFKEQPGVDRIVPARELSLEELRSMREASDLDIETFIHGALCYSYSGQCLFSSILGGRSGNRGRCAQPCRLPYQYGKDGEHFRAGKESCPLSLKDICTLEILPQIIEAGVTSLKIEGRMKKTDYTQGVVSIYRKYLDRYLADPAHYQVEEEDKKTLLSLFNRGGSCDGYYRRRNGREMMAFANEKKIGDVKVQVIKNKEKVKANLILFPGNPAILELDYAGVRVKAEAGEVQKAQNQPVTRERILAQMKKSGSTPYVLEPLELEVEGNIFLPVRVLNELRRQGLGQLSEKLADSFVRPPAKRPSFTEQRKETGQGKLPRKFYVSCETKEQFALCERSPMVQGIYGNYQEVADCLRRGNPEEKELFWMFPHVERRGDGEFFSQERCRELLEQGLSGFLVRSLESFCRLKKYGLASKCVLDASLYAWNHLAQDFWRQQGILRETVPVELNYKELLHRDNSRSELLVYGYLPLMISAQCVQKNLDRCRKDCGLSYLKDRYGKTFPVKSFCGSCYNVIYNSLPFGLEGEMDLVKHLSPQSLRISFTIEEPKEAGRILEEFTRICQGRPGISSAELTKGHFKRGVE